MEGNAVDAYPTYIVIDGDGVQRGRFEGQSSVKHVDTEIRQWLAELPKPPPR